MYSGRKKTKTDWALSIFMGLAVLILVGVIAYGVYLTRGDHQHGGRPTASEPRTNLLETKNR